MIVGPMGVEDDGERRKLNISRFVVVSQFEICERGFDESIEEKVRNFLRDTAHQVAEQTAAHSQATGKGKVREVPLIPSSATMLQVA